MHKRFAAVVVLGALSAFTGIAVASASGATPPFSAHGSGTAVSVVQNQTTQTGTVMGTLIGRGSFSGSEAAANAPPPCGSGPGAPATGSNTTTAANGDLLYTTNAGTLCVSASNSTSTTYQLTARFTITGGTGRFAGASGGGTTSATATLSATAQGSHGPVVYMQRGTIDLAP
jgi:hypothetical protein